MDRVAIGSTRGRPPHKGPEQKGILHHCSLPVDEFDAQWDAVIVDQEIKDRLLSQAVLTFTVRPKLRHSTLPLHGVILLVGPPGTGKTSLARGLASRAGAALGGKLHYAEVEPHALASSSLGKSQQSVTHLLGTTIAEYAANGPLIVLLDEVETLAADRSRMSLEANPIDVHRATDAVLAQLDHLAASTPNLLFLATSNFPQAIDKAFLSRADLVVTIGLPSEAACYEILKSTVAELATAFRPLQHLVDDPSLRTAARSCHGMDGRRIRKVVLSALAQNKDVALHPERLSAADILNAAKHAAKEMGEGRRS